MQTRTKLALERYNGRVKKAYERTLGASNANPMFVQQLSAGAAQYAVDFAQRSILFWDTLRQRGNNFLEHERQGLPPVLHFDYETIMDGRSLKRPVNYALLRIVPPKGMTVDPNRRPYVIIDPRGGHGPGIGGFKDDSQVGVALREGHPVYFVVFFQNPEPGQTLLDVCDAEREFVHRVRELHPNAEKPAIVGNCQAGWAAMMLAASNPDDTGPIVIVGAPMSYWGGAWREGEGDNPMRYAGGLLGGTWLSSLAADVGAGKFDGAYLVQNFENLNPANTFWDKYYNVFANIDTEPARFLEFERWWGGYFLMNREEIEWITQNLFVGNKVWSGATKSGPGGIFDLRQIKVPIVLFASLGDNITPPQQAFNWVADVYGSTEEIKARGQVIVGLMHEDIGHLGIFVSGRGREEGARADRLGAEIDRSAAAGPLWNAHRREEGRRRTLVRRELRRVASRRNNRAPQSLQARRREAVRGRQRGRRVQSARVRAFRASHREGVRQRVRRQALAPLSSAARAALGVLRSQSSALVARAGCQGREGAPAGHFGGASAAQRRVVGVGIDQCLARFAARAARRLFRSDVLRDLRQPRGLLPSRPAKR